MNAEDRQSPSGDKLQTILVHYGLLSTLIVTACLIIAAVTLGALIVEKVSEEPAFKKYGEKKLRAVYPHRDTSEIKQLLKDTRCMTIGYEAFTSFREKAYKSKYVNVDEAGFRINKKQGQWPPDPSSYVVFVFGGSTTFGYGATDEETIPAYLQNCISSFRPNARIYNFGRGFYYSTQERILFENLLMSGFVPNMAIFIDGVNDFWHTGKQGAWDRTFENCMYCPWKEMRRYVPPIEWAAELYHGAKRMLRQSPAEPELEKYNDQAAIGRVLDRYLRNKKAIEAVAQAYGIKTRFVWQPVPTYQYGVEHHILIEKLSDFGDHLYSKLGYPAARKMYDAGRFGGNFLWCAEMQKDREEALYVDPLHYSASFSSEIAQAICKWLKEESAE